MYQAREEFLLGTNKKHIAGRLRDKVKAQLKLHEFSLEDRRDKYVGKHYTFTTRPVNCVKLYLTILSAG